MQSKLRCCGIDLGTTNSEIYTYKDGHPDALLPPTGARITPSRVGVDPGSTRGNIRYVTGNRLKNLANKKPENVIYEPKRLVGRAFSHQDVKRDRFYWPFRLEEGEGKKPKYHISVSNGEVDLSAVDIDAQILKLLASYPKGGVESAVITVPSYFTKEQIEETTAAGELAGLKVLRCLPEPVAASIAYGHGRKVENERVLVYDLGGGTFDCCIVEIENGRYYIKKSDGHSHLGGADFDNAIVKKIAGEIREKFNYDIHSNKKDLAKLKEAAEKAKIALSDADSYEIQFKTKDMAGSDIIYNHQLTRAEFNALIKQLIEKTITYIQNILKECVLTPQNIDCVLLVGGSTRIPYVKERLREFFNREINDNVVNIDEAVAEGAAIYAHFLVEKGVDLCKGLEESNTRPVYNADGDPLDEVPYNIYYRQEGSNKLKTLFTKGDSLVAGDANSMLKRLRKIIPVMDFQKYCLIDILIQIPESGKFKVVDQMKLEIEEPREFDRSQSANHQNAITLVGTYSAYGRLTFVLTDKQSKQSETISILLRGDMDDDKEDVKLYIELRNNLEQMMLSTMTKEQNDNVESLRDDIMKALGDLREIGSHEYDDLIDFRDETFRDLEERLRNL